MHSRNLKLQAADRQASGKHKIPSQILQVLRFLCKYIAQFTKYIMATCICHTGPPRQLTVPASTVTYRRTLAPSP